MKREIFTLTAVAMTASFGAVTTASAQGMDGAANGAPNWSGVKVGIGGGGSLFTTVADIWGHDWYYDCCTPVGNFDFDNWDDFHRTDITGTGGFFTGEIGADMQRGRWVFGLFGDVRVGKQKGDFTGYTEDTVDIDGSGSKYFYLNNDREYNASVELGTGYSLVARVGHLVSDHTLFYGFAGYSWRKYEASIQKVSDFYWEGDYDCCYFDGGDTKYPGASKKGTMGGLVLGAGMEFKIPDTRTSIKGEYRFERFGGIKTIGDKECECDWGSDVYFRTDNINNHSIRAVLSVDLWGPNH